MDEYPIVTKIPRELDADERHEISELWGWGEQRTEARGQIIVEAWRAAKRFYHERDVLTHPDVQAAFADEEIQRNLSAFESGLNGRPV